MYIKQTYIWYTYDIHNIQYIHNIHNIHHRHHIQKTSRRTGNRARKNNVFKKNTIFAMAKHTFLQAELCQILAREFGKIRVSCGFWIHFIGACWQAFSFLLFKAGASALNLFLLEMGMQIHIYIYICIYMHIFSKATCIQRSNATRHLCSVTTWSGRSTRNVNMPPPPTHPAPSWPANTR